MIRRRTVMILVAVAAVVVAVAALMAHRRPAEPPAASTAQPAPNSPSSLLVITWAPALCAVEKSASGCRSGRVDKHGQNFLLHGLWPQPREQQYCGVPKHSKDRRPVDLPPDLQERLQAMMSDPKVLAPHEWYAHGTCSGVTPTEYFGIAATLADQAIEVLDPVFDGAAGGKLSARSVREAVDARLGNGSGARISLSCRDSPGRGAVVFEVRLSLPPVAQLRPDTPSLAEALAGAPAVAPGCGQGVVR
jgi:ribonuclease T2